MPTDATPAAVGCRWPAEWEPHAATWVAWPHNRDTWPGRFDVVPPVFARLVRTIAQFEPVKILAGGEQVLAQAESFVGDLPNVTLLDIETDDAWCRDHGPTFLVQSPGSSLALVDWQYNAWGGKYPPFDRDNAVPRQIAKRILCRRFSANLVLEGGAIEGNGQGTILTTETCLLNPNRNPGVDRAQAERLLGDYLGATTVIWLPRGELSGDDTDGHVDQLARFVDPSTVVVAISEDRLDENYEPLQENCNFLRRASEQDGNQLCVVPLPLPAPKCFQTQRLPASYCNFYIANGLVAVPQFDDRADEQALRILAELFPQREVRGIPSLDLVWGLGAVHCLTQQEPAGAGTTPLCRTATVNA